MSFEAIWRHRDYHTKRSKLDRKRQIYDSIYMWNLKRWYKKNLFTKQIQTYRLRKQTYGNQSRKVGGDGDKLGIWD